MTKLDPRSPDAIRIYLLLGGASAGFLLAFLLVVPLLRSTCTWFTARCMSVQVQQGDNNALLVITPHATYYYDGNQYIFAYGDYLPGTCPQVVASGTSATPTVAPSAAGVCFSYKDTSDDPACVAGDDSKCSQCIMEAPPLCARAADQLPSGKFTCDGTTPLDSQQCCAYTAPCPPNQRCIATQPASLTGGSCPNGRLVDTDLCDFSPQYKAGQGYTCDGITFTPQPQCCLCSGSVHNVAFPGTTDAQGNIFEPTFALDAASMQLLPINHGVVCGVQRSIVLQQFRDKPRRVVKLTLPRDTTAPDIYQVFDVLRHNGLLRVQTKPK